jgi:hypothetical protein
VLYQCLGVSKHTKFGKTAPKQSYRFKLSFILIWYMIYSYHFTLLDVKIKTRKFEIVIVHVINKLVHLKCVAVCLQFYPWVVEVVVDDYHHVLQYTPAIATEENIH